MPLLHCPLPLLSPAPALPLEGSFDRSIASNSDLLTLMNSRLGGGALTGLTGGNNGLGIGGLTLRCCSLVTGVSVLLSLADLDADSALSENVLSPCRPTVDSTDRILKLRIAKMNSASSSNAIKMAKLRCFRSLLFDSFGHLACLEKAIQIRLFSTCRVGLKAHD